jgi:hypothetical protein
MGYIAITRGNRYKGFEYKVSTRHDLERLTDNPGSHNNRKLSLYSFQGIHQLKA